MILTLVRHAKSCWDDPALIDFHRPLSNRGLRDAPIMAAWLRANAAPPDHWLSSPAKRALCTAAVFAYSFGRPVEGLIHDPRIYLADVKDWLDVIASIPPTCRHAIAFGHNPGIQELIAHLTGAAAVEIPTCAIIQLKLRMSSNPDLIRGKVKQIATPKSLRL